ncbi:MAG: hypothetical protein ACYSSN_10360 [Planctomycetota bacterium]|jgi:hypothetical protein
MKIFEKSLGQNYYYFAICETEQYEKVENYINQISGVWDTMVKVFGLKPRFKRYFVIFSNQDHNNKEYSGAFYLPSGLIFMKPDDHVICNNPDYVWGGMIHETLHAFLEPLKWYPGGQLDYQHQNFIDGENNNQEGFNLILQKEIYKNLNKQELITKLEDEQKNNTFFKTLNSVIEEKGIEAVQKLFKKMV